MSRMLKNKKKSNVSSNLLIAVRQCFVSSAPASICLQSGSAANINWKVLNVGEGDIFTEVEYMELHCCHSLKKFIFLSL